MAYLQNRNTRINSVGQQPWEVMVSIIETDATGNPITWVGSDGNVYGYGNDGNIYDLTPEYATNTRPSGINANPYDAGYRDTYTNNNVSIGNNNSAVRIGGGQANSAVSVGRNKIRMSNNEKSTTTTTNNANIKVEEKQMEVIKDFKPRPGSEMIPLYDPEREKVEVILYREIKEFELKIVKKDKE